MATRNRRRSPGASCQDTQRLNELRAAMEEGWKVETPILARPGWSNRPGTPWALHFILALRERRKLFVIHDNPIVREFLAEQHLAEAVVY